MTELEYAIKHGGLTPKRLLQRITRRGFGASVVGALDGVAASRLAAAPSAGADFTIALIPDPQYLAEDCPDRSGLYYTAMMRWIVANKSIVLTASASPFNANIKAVVGVGDYVNATADDQYKNAQAAWTILDAHRIAFTTPPGNHDYTGGLSTRQRPANRRRLRSSVSQSNGAGQIASVFLLIRQPALGLLEGRMISARSGQWFGAKSHPFPLAQTGARPKRSSSPFRSGACPHM